MYSYIMKILHHIEYDQVAHYRFGVQKCNPETRSDIFPHKTTTTSFAGYKNRWHDKTGNHNLSRLQKCNPETLMRIPQWGEPSIHMRIQPTQRGIYPHKATTISFAGYKNVTREYRDFFFV